MVAALSFIASNKDFSDALHIRAPQGRVMIDAEEGVMDNVQIETKEKEGAQICSKITQLQTPLYSRSWDYTKELLEQQRRSMMPGGMPGIMMPETAAFQFSFGGSGSSVSGFAPVVDEGFDIYNPQDSQVHPLAKGNCTPFVRPIKS